MVAILLAVALAGEVSEKQIADYLQRCKAERPAALVAARKQLVAARRDRSETPQQRAWTLKERNAKVKALSDKKQPYYAPMESPLHYPVDGAIGHVDQPVDVIQVVDSGNAIVEAYFMGQAGYPPRPVKGDQVLYWLKGDTEFFADGESARLQGVFVIGGTTTYQTRAGTRTVRVLEEVPGDLLGEPHRNAAKPAD